MQVSPVVSLENLSTNAVQGIKEHARVDMVALTSPPAPGDWAVDLRISLPVAKEVLLTRTPTAGFATEDDALAFAERLAVKTNRPALHPSLSEDLPKSLTDLMRTQRKNDPEWWHKVQQLRINVTGGTRLAPLKVRLIVVEYATLTPDEREVWREWAKSFGRQLRKAGCGQMLPPHFATLDNLSARLYVESVPIRETVFPR